jgi:hypothetical protein
MNDSTPIPDNDAISEMFASRVCDPLVWFKHARSLLAAGRSTIERAKVLIDPWERSDLENVAYMLYGFSLENLFKGKWILREFGPSHHEGWHPVSRFPSQLKTHNLVRLAKLVHPELLPTQEHTLEVLSDVTTWSGRYPCSLEGSEGTLIRYPNMDIAAEEIFRQCSREFTAMS